MLANFHTILIANLRGEIPSDDKAYLNPQEAHDVLKIITEQDFGRDADTWEDWFVDKPFEIAFKGFGKWMAQKQKKSIFVE